MLDYLNGTRTLETDILRTYASAPGKVILTGEHFVVFGAPALAIAINRRIVVGVNQRTDRRLHIVSSLGKSGEFEQDKFNLEEGGPEARDFLEPVRIAAESVLKRYGANKGLNIQVNSDVPVASGLGSSSAISVATVASVGEAIGLNLSKEEILDLSLTAERFVHKNPSGIDIAIATFGGTILYERERGMTRIEDMPNLALVIGNTGIARNTGSLVESVRRRRDHFPSTINPLIAAAQALTGSAVEALRARDLEKLGELLDINHGLLAAVGTSCIELDRLVYAARSVGALGAKLTGAGGGGCMIALCSDENLVTVSEAIRRANGSPITVVKTEEGVLTWKEN
jgi:mevalonate kinase